MRTPLRHWRCSPPPLSFFSLSKVCIVISKFVPRLEESRLKKKKSTLIIVVCTEKVCFVYFAM